MADDLFYVDTKGEANYTVGETQKTVGIKVVENTTSVPVKEYPKSSVTCLNDEFVGLGVNSNLTQTPMVKEEEEYVDSDEGEEELDSTFSDFVNNLGSDGIMKLLKDASNHSGYLSRNIDGGVDYRSDLSGDENMDLEGILIAEEQEDPYKYEDQVYEQIYKGSSDEDEFDGVDEEVLPGPGAGDGGGKHLSKQQNINKFKEKDRNKIKNSKNKKNKGDGPSPGFSPRTIIKRLNMLVLSEDLDSVWLQPMNKYERQIVHVLAREYKVKSKSMGNGERKTPVLTAVPESRSPTNRYRVNRVVQLFDSGALVPEQLYASGSSNPINCVSYASNHHNKDQKKQQKQQKQKQQKSKKKQKGQPMDNMPGKMVAENAPEVGAGNVGHKMLTQMGWQPGQGLGATDQQGRSTPVDVMIRSGRRGLGA